MRTLYGVFMVTVLAALLVACGGGRSDDEPTAEPTESNPATTTTATAPADEPSSTPTDEPEDETPTAASPTTVATVAPTASPTTEVTVAPTASPTRPAPTATQPVPTATPVPPAATPWPPAQLTIQGQPSVWSQSSVTGGVGSAITWQWADNIHAHNLSVTGHLTAGNPTRQGKFTVTFESKGTFIYSCEAHPDTMFGTVEIR